LKPDGDALKCVECKRVYPIRDDIHNGRTRTGFRFQTLKLYNWGTFDNQVWRI
jgi:uncharacterized protein YPO0396